MEVHIHKSGDVTVVVPAEPSLDAGNTKRFKEEVVPKFEGAGKVLVDLSQVQFLDSSGLGALLSALRRVRAAGGDLRLCGVNRVVQALFELVRLHRVFDIYKTREDGLRAFAAAGPTPGK